MAVALSSTELRLGEPRRYGVGLRAQTLLALTAAFVVSFSALSIVVVQAAQKSHEIEHGRRASALVEGLAATLGTTPSGIDRERALAALLGRGEVIGTKLDTLAGAAIAFGASRGAPTASAMLADGERLSVWTQAREPDEVSPLARLLRLYALLTGCLILAVVYIALTRLIVRPVENLTRAVERLPSGHPSSLRSASDAPIGIEGAAEVVRLAIAFNQMTRALHREKRALELQLEELEQTTVNLRSTQDQLLRSEKLAGVGRLAAGVAHEIGNPLSAILGLVELLQRTNLSRAEEREFLGRIRNETERIHRIIRDLLDYSRTPPAAAAQPPAADLEQVVEEAVALVVPQKELSRVTIERRVHGDLPRVCGSAHELTQLVVNLLLNASDAVGGEGDILVELKQEGGEVLLTISDTGPGIAAAMRVRLFEPFATTKPPGKGTGLGLAVCHAIVTRLGGAIVGENLPHRGARFAVRIPAALE